MRLHADRIITGTAVPMSLSILKHNSRVAPSLAANTKQLEHQRKADRVRDLISPETRTSQALLTIVHHLDVADTQQGILVGGANPYQTANALQVQLDMLYRHVVDAVQFDVDDATCQSTKRLFLNELGWMDGGSSCGLVFSD